MFKCIMICLRSVIKVSCRVIKFVVECVSEVSFLVDFESSCFEFYSDFFEVNIMYNFKV